MPELPEVEVVRRGLEPLLPGCRITGVETSGLPLRAPVPLARLRGLALGGVIRRVERRAKYLLLPLANGALIILHLGMTGKLYPAKPEEPPRKHDHLTLLLEQLAPPGPAAASTQVQPTEPAAAQKEIVAVQQGHQPVGSTECKRSAAPEIELRFNDCRRFGLVAIYSPEEAAAPPLLADLGPEPLDEKAFSAAYLLARCRRRQTPIKNLLMDNRVVVGIGNIYANETLFAAGISPFAPAATLSPARARRLVTAARQILTRAIAAGGTTIADFANAAGEAGYFQVQLAVYGRHGQPCPRCTKMAKKKKGSDPNLSNLSPPIIQRQPQAGRPTFFCPRCQQ